MARKITMAEYVTLAGKWDVGALVSFQMWLTRSDVWVPLHVDVWELYHTMWARGCEPLAERVAHVG